MPVTKTLCSSITAVAVRLLEALAGDCHSMRWVLPQARTLSAFIHWTSAVPSTATRIKSTQLTLTE